MPTQKTAAQNGIRKGPCSLRGGLEAKPPRSFAFKKGERVNRAQREGENPEMGFPHSSYNFSVFF